MTPKTNSMALKQDQQERDTGYALPQLHTMPVKKTNRFLHFGANAADFFFSRRGKKNLDEFGSYLCTLMKSTPDPTPKSTPPAGG